jgi:hypothetical protein
MQPKAINTAVLPSSPHQNLVWLDTSTTGLLQQENQRTLQALHATPLSLSTELLGQWQTYESSKMDTYTHSTRPSTSHLDVSVSLRIDSSQYILSSLFDYEGHRFHSHPLSKSAIAHWEQEISSIMDFQTLLD